MLEKIIVKLRYILLKLSSVKIFALIAPIGVMALLIVFGFDSKIEAPALSRDNSREELKSQDMPSIDPVISIKGDVNFLEDDLRPDENVLFFASFDENPWNKNLYPTLSSGNSNFEILSPPNSKYGKSMRTFYKQGSYANRSSPSGTSSTIFSIPLEKNGIGIGAKNEIYLRYLVQFQDKFAFGKSGKLPGMGGGDNNAGGNPPNGTDGWSGRVVWADGGALESYLYVPGVKKYGREIPWLINSQPQLLATGRWNCIEVRFVLNTPGVANGIMEGWLNGMKAMSGNDILYRTTESLKIDTLLFHTFFGGSTPDYASPQDQYAYFDNVVMSDKYIGCPNNF